MRINACMLFGSQYDLKMRVVPQIGIASYIANFGHNVIWILFSEKTKRVQETTFNDVHVFIVPCQYSKCILKFCSIPLCALRKIRFLLNMFKKERCNIIFVRDDVFEGLIALYIKRKYKIPFVFEKSDPMEQIFVFRKFYWKYKRFGYFISKIEANLTMHILRKADLVLPTTKWMLDDFANKGIERSKMMPYPNGIDTNLFINTTGDGIRKKYRIDNSKVVIYVGTMDKLRHLDTLIHAFSKVREKKGNVKLFMVGNGTDKSNLERLANDLGIKDDVIFTGQVHYREVPNFIAVADIGVSFVPPLDFYRLSSPIKMLEYMAMNKPVVANEEIPEQKEVIEESGGGILVRFEDKSFADGIIELLNNPGEARERGRKGHDWLVKNRSYKILARRLEERYSGLLSEESPV